MNCQRFEQVVSDLARGQMMEADVRAEALVHSEQCEHCSVRLADEERLTRGLQFLAADMESFAAPAGVELKLREAFRQRHAVVPMAAPSSRSRYWLVAVAAALLVVMSVTVMWLGADAPQEKLADNAPQKKVEEPVPGPNPVSPTSPAPPTNPVAPAPKEDEYRAVNDVPKRQAPKPGRRNVENRKRRENQMANHASNEIATDFMPLGDANTLVLQDGGQIIRVKLPRSTLVRFGFPVNMDRYNENVKADVIVGVDGLARAIRFVQ
jgi:hypothetical protein